MISTINLNDIGAKVHERIIIGSLGTAINLCNKNPHSITASINLSNQRYVSTIPVINIDLDDTIITPHNFEHIINRFNDGICAINKILSINPKNTILIHCAQGINRSATLIALYLIKFADYSYEDCISALENANAIRQYPLLTNYSFKELLRTVHNDHVSKKI